MTLTSMEDQVTQTNRLTETTELRRQIEEVVTATPVVDMHTHLFAPEFGEMNLYGIDELLTYHYLIAETFRSTRITAECFWQMSKAEQAGKRCS
jgi:tRNA/tmRNA/rRNA uracil-C5-methylase (TrmA/RlmC/RlmD family)